MPEGKADQELGLLKEHVKALEEMLSSTTAYMTQIQEQLEASKLQLSNQNKNLERIVNQRTTELKQLVVNLEKEVREKELMQQNLHIANSELNTLLYRSSHDFKGPICTAFGLLSLIGDKVENPEAREYIHMLQRPLKRLDSLTKTITSIAEFRQGELKQHGVDVPALMHKQLEAFQDLLGSKYSVPELSFKGNCTFLSDEYYVECILNCLIDNALKYRVQGRVHQVSIAVQPYYQQLKIVVTDNGTGIPEAFLPRVWDMFFRGSELSTGSGLGLYLSKLAVDKLGGKIKIKSEVSKGTRVSVYLPGLQP